MPAIDDKDRTMWVFEPHVAEKVFDELLAGHDVPVYRDEWLDRDSGVKKEGARIRSITTLSGKVFQGRAFIDATYEGDLLAAAGISYAVGREASDMYGEPSGGVQKGVLESGHCFDEPISAYAVPGQPASGLLPRVSAEPPDEDGQGDPRIEAYGYRMCLRGGSQFSS